MNKYLDFESDIETLDNKINNLSINDNNFINETNKLNDKKYKILKKNTQTYQHGKKCKLQDMPIDLTQ